MQRTFFLLLSVLLSLPLCTLGQMIPQGISYQAVIRDSGAVLARTPVELEMQVYAGEEAIYAETHAVTTNEFGLVNLTVGKGSPIFGDFATIDWTTQPTSLGITLSIGDEQKELGIQAFWSVPYSIQSAYSLQSDSSQFSIASQRSQTSISSDSSSYSDFSAEVAPFPISQLVDVDADRPDSAMVLTWDGSMWRPMSLPEPDTLIGGKGILIQGNTIINSGDSDASDDLTIGTSAGGDLSGSLPDPSVVALQGWSVDTAAPALDEILRWNGKDWTPSPDLVGQSPWSSNGNLLYYTQGNVSIGTSNNGGAALNVGGNLRGYLLNSLSYSLSATLTGGEISTYGPSSTNLELSAHPSNSNLGQLQAFNASSLTRARFGVNTDGVGEVLLQGANGQTTVRINTLIGSPNNGYISVRNPSGNAAAGIYVNGSGQGIVFGDQKNFRMQHPTRPGKEIWYGSLEGPELGAYTRGTATLVNGEVWIPFPEHFELVANPQTMTVQLTPLDRSSKGLAVIEKTAKGIRVAELQQGQGNYDFDWYVTCVRRGYEDFEVVRDALEPVDK